MKENILKSRTPSGEIGALINDFAPKAKINNPSEQNQNKVSFILVHAITKKFNNFFPCDFFLQKPIGIHKN